MDFRLPCGHTRRIGYRDNFFRALREGCMLCHLEAKEREALLASMPTLEERLDIFDPNNKDYAHDDD